MCDLTKFAAAKGDFCYQKSYPVCSELPSAREDKHPLCDVCLFAGILGVLSQHNTHAIDSIMEGVVNHIQVLIW